MRRSAGHGIVSLESETLLAGEEPDREPDRQQGCGGEGERADEQRAGAGGADEQAPEGEGDV